MNRRVLVALIVALGVVGAVLILNVSGDDPTPDPAAVETHEAMGSFTADISTEDIAGFDILDKSFTGEWELAIEADQYVLTHGENFRAPEDITFDGDIMVIDATPAPVGTYNCYDENDERLTDDGEAAATYELTLEGDELTLTPIEEPCPLRDLFLTRTWFLAENTGDMDTET